MPWSVLANAGNFSKLEGTLDDDGNKRYLSDGESGVLSNAKLQTLPFSPDKCHLEKSIDV